MHKFPHKNLQSFFYKSLCNLLLNRNAYPPIISKSHFITARKAYIMSYIALLLINFPEFVLVVSMSDFPLLFLFFSLACSNHCRKWTHYLVGNRLFPMVLLQMLESISVLSKNGE